MADGEAVRIKDSILIVMVTDLKKITSIGKVMVIVMIIHLV